jgi:hypothetical protein
VFSPTNLSLMSDCRNSISCLAIIFTFVLSQTSPLYW